MLYYDKSAFERTAFHFAVGNGISTLIAALIILRGPPSHYPLTLTCGGVFVVVIQCLLLIISVWFRHFVRRSSLKERNALVTVLAGFSGGVLVFALPAIIEKSTNNTVTLLLATVFALCIYPIAVSPIVFSRRKINQLP